VNGGTSYFDLFRHPIGHFASRESQAAGRKGLARFRLVREKPATDGGRPYSSRCCRVVDIFRPAFDEERLGDPAHNTQIIWREFMLAGN